MPAGCHADLQLYLLEQGDARRLAALVSRHQAIAGDPRLTTLPAYGAHVQGQERGMNLP